jgi:hypothetical protein
VLGGLISPDQSVAQTDLQAENQSGGVPMEQIPGTSLFSRSPFRLDLAFDGGYDDNVNTNDLNQKGSAFADGQGTLSGKIGTERSNLTLNSMVQLIYFTDNVGIVNNPEINSQFSLDAFHSVSRRLQLRADLRAAYQEEPDFSANIGPNRRVGYFFNTDDSVSASFEWFQDFSTVTTARARWVRYDDAIVGALDNRVEGTIGEQFRYSLRRVVLVGEYRFEIIRYDTAPLDSTSHYLLGGIDYQVNQQMNVTIRGGATLRTYDQGTNKTEPEAEGTLNYQIGRTSALSLNARYGLEEPDATFAFGTRTTFRVGLQLHQWLTAHIQAILASYYTHDDNETLSNGPGVAVSQQVNSYDVSGTLLYALNRRWAVHVNFERSGIDSGLMGQNYTRDRYSAGFYLSF